MTTPKEPGAGQTPMNTGIFNSKMLRAAYPNMTEEMANLISDTLNTYDKFKDNFDVLLKAAFAVIDDTEISRVAHREFCGKLDDLKEAIRQCGGRG